MNNKIVDVLREMTHYYLQPRIRETEGGRVRYKALQSAIDCMKENKKLKNKLFEVTNQREDLKLTLKIASEMLPEKKENYIRTKDGKMTHDGIFFEARNQAIDEAAPVVAKLVKERDEAKETLSGVLDASVKAHKERNTLQEENKRLREEIVILKKQYADLDELRNDNVKNYLDEWNILEGRLIHRQKECNKLQATLDRVKGVSEEGIIKLLVKLPLIIPVANKNIIAKAIKARIDKEIEGE